MERCGLALTSVLLACWPAGAAKEEHLLLLLLWVASSAGLLSGYICVLWASEYIWIHVVSECAPTWWLPSRVPRLPTILLARLLGAGKEQLSLVPVLPSVLAAQAAQAQMGAACGPWLPGLPCLAGSLAHPVQHCLACFWQAGGQDVPHGETACPTAFSWLAGPTDLDDFFFLQQMKTFLRVRPVFSKSLSISCTYSKYCPLSRKHKQQSIQIAYMMKYLLLGNMTCKMAAWLQRISGSFRIWTKAERQLDISLNYRFNWWLIKWYMNHQNLPTCSGFSHAWFSFWVETRYFIFLTARHWSTHTITCDIDQDLSSSSWNIFSWHIFCFILINVNRLSEAISVTWSITCSHEISSIFIFNNWCNCLKYMNQSNLVQPVKCCPSSVQ